MLETRIKLAVFSDLDGTLLDHETYDLEPARPALNLLKSGGHILVLASSKTAAEMKPIRELAGFSHCPAIIENGAGFLPPDGDVSILGRFASVIGDGIKQVDTANYDDIRSILAGLPEELRAGFSGFGDWTIEQVSVNTGLSLRAAELAKQRQFSEPGLWQGSEQGFQDFKKILSGHGLVIQRGGRFWTISGGQTKADAMGRIVTALRARETTYFQTRVVALGDAPNDLGMLAAAECAFVIENPANPHLATEMVASLVNEPALNPQPKSIYQSVWGKKGTITIPESSGPWGWCEAISHELESV